MPVQLIMIRHGETEWNQVGRWQGHQDVGLSDEGQRRIQQVASVTAGWGSQAAQIYSSDLSRAYRTAWGLFPFQQSQIIRDARLREIHLGHWEGLTREEILEQDEAGFLSFDGKPEGPAPGGETFNQCKNRVKEWWDEYWPTWRDDDCIIVVGHGGSLRALLFALIPELPNPVRKHFTLENLGVSLIEVNASQHAALRRWNVRPEWIGRELIRC